MSVGRYITYQLIYKTEPPENLLDLLKGFSKSDILVCLAGINNFPTRDLIYHTIPREQQLYMIRWILGDHLIEKVKRLSNSIGSYLLNEKVDYVLFHRTASVVAINNVLQNEFSKSTTIDDPELIIKYYLGINSELEKYQESKRTDDDEFMDTILTIAATNEYSYPFIPVLQLFRGVKLVKHLRKNDRFRQHFDDYRKQIGVDIYLMYMFALSTLSKIAGNDDVNKLPVMGNPPHFQKLGALFTDSQASSEYLLEVLAIKSAPFYKYKEDANLILDIAFLADFFYHTLIFKFWFEYVKPYTEESAKEYFSIRGKFLELHVSELIKRAFKHLKHPPPKTLDELKVVHPNTGSEIELCDFFVKENKKLLIGEVKSSPLNTVDKYSKEYRDKTNENEGDFNSKFGFIQIAKGIKNLIEFPELYSNKLNKKHRYTVFPVILLQERAFIAPFVHIKIQEHFRYELKALLDDISFPEHSYEIITYENLSIYPVTQINILTLELLIPELEARKFKIWDYLKKIHKPMAFDPPFLHAYNLSTSQYYDAYPEVREILRTYDEERKSQRDQS